jgi:hypothetical protein
MPDDPLDGPVDVAAASPMPGALQIRLGIVGTFDVENYGDLLFPLLARAELSRRLPAASITAFSYNARSAPQWPYDVRPVASLVDGGSDLAGLLIGGGQLVRTDAYFPIPVSAGTVVPYDVWLFPALAALALHIPCPWNAIGAWEKGVAFPPAVREMFAAAVRGSHRVAVRDAISAHVFDTVAGMPVARQVPDTGFGLRRLVDAGMPSAVYAEWRRLHGIAGPYVAIQATVHLASARAALHNLRTILPDAKFVLLPICKVHGATASRNWPPARGRPRGWPITRARSIATGMRRPTSSTPDALPVRANRIDARLRNGRCALRGGRSPVSSPRQCGFGTPEAAPDKGSAAVRA